MLAVDRQFILPLRLYNLDIDEFIYLFIYLFSYYILFWCAVYYEMFKFLLYLKHYLIGAITQLILIICFSLDAI